MSKIDKALLQNIWVYDSTLYTVLNPSAKMKHPQTREWVLAVVYVQKYGDETQFIRMKSEFLSKFKKV